MIAKHEKYEWRYKLVSKGLEKVHELIYKNRFDESINNTENVSEAKMIIIENACLCMDFIVNFSEEIYMIFNKLQKKTGTDWKENLKFSLDFLENNLDLLDELTTKEYEFVKENWLKIINEEPLPVYPYENNILKEIDLTERLYQNEKDLLKKEKKKKLKKGPTLNAKNEL
jgi:ERK and JNK pathways, inhibitor